MIKKIVGCLALIYILAIPQMSAAQTTGEDEYRAYLLSVIELLQQQIILLTEEQNLQNRNYLIVSNDEADFKSFLLDDGGDLEAWYEIDHPREVMKITDPTHREYLSRFFELVPNEYDEYFLELVVFENNDYDFDGFVETVSPYREDTWRFGVNQEIFDFKSTSNLVAELFIHEFAHIVSYEKILGVVEPKNITCHEYFSELGCPPASSYLNDFMKKFWSATDLDDLVNTNNPESIWTEQELQENFVSDYAATSPAEDFAESFTFFVLEGEVEGDDLSDQKINYFASHEKMLKIRNEILNNL